MRGGGVKGRQAQGGGERKGKDRFKTTSELLEIKGKYRVENRRPDPKGCEEGADGVIRTGWGTKKRGKRRL